MIHRTQSTRAHENSKYQSYLQYTTIHKKTRTSSNESNTQEEEEDKEEVLHSRIESERERALES
jgi:hypothetical protein